MVRIYTDRGKMWIQNFTIVKLQIDPGGLLEGALKRGGSKVDSFIKEIFEKRLFSIVLKNFVYQWC